MRCVRPRCGRRCRERCNWVSTLSIMVSMVPILEAVPNFSEGRDLGWIRELLEVIAGEGVDVLDWTADRDHHRSVVTYMGNPESVEAASLAAALFAIDGIDLRTHRGIHPRIGALDVLPFVPLHDLTMDSAVESARRVAGQLAAEGVPVYFYGEAHHSGMRSDGSLASIRRGGFEALREGFPAGREPNSPHPTRFRSWVPRRNGSGRAPEVRSPVATPT